MPNRSLQLALAGVLVVTLTLLGLGSYLGEPILFAASVHWLLLLVLAGGTLRQQKNGEDAGQYLAAARLGLGALVLSESVVGYQILTRDLLVPWDTPAFLSSPGLLLAGATVMMLLLGIWFESRSQSGSADDGGLAKVCRVGTILGLIGTGACFVPVELLETVTGPTALLLLAVPSVLALELVLRGLQAFFAPTVSPSDFGADLVSARFLGSSYNPIQSVLLAIEATFDVDVRSSWVLDFLRSVALPVLTGFTLVVWALSSFVIVDASQLAVRERFGKVDADSVLQPGVVIGLPWPFDQVRRVDVTRVRSVPLGYTDPKAGADALWTQYHAEKEFNLLLGDGRDLLTINAEVVYRVGDVHDWLYNCQNPTLALQTLSYRALMEATANKPLDLVLSRDISSFSEHMHGEIQALADEKNLGIEVVAFNLWGLHPPVAVAEEYQAVVAAQLDRRTFKLDAEADRESELPRARAAALQKTLQTEAERVTRLATANGEATAFKALYTEYKLRPDVYRYRKRLETLESVLEKDPHYIVDSRIERDGGAVWILNN